MFRIIFLLSFFSVRNLIVLQMRFVDAVTVSLGRDIRKDHLFPWLRG